MLLRSAILRGPVFRGRPVLISLLLLRRTVILLVLLILFWLILRLLRLGWPVLRLFGRPLPTLRSGRRPSAYADRDGQQPDPKLESRLHSRFLIQPQPHAATTYRSHTAGSRYSD